MAKPGKPKNEPAPPAAPRPPTGPPSDADLMFAGKTPGQMTREELIRCAVRFRDAHVETVHRLANADRRMAKLEEGFSKEQIAKLDRWLAAHPRDSARGDGSPFYTNWRAWDG